VRVTSFYDVTLWCRFWLCVSGIAGVRIWTPPVLATDRRHWLIVLTYVCLCVCLIVSVCVSLSLIDVSSAEQTAVSHSALMQIINFDDAENIEPAERYLLATALSTHPTESTLKHLLVRRTLYGLILSLIFTRATLARMSVRPSVTSRSSIKWPPERTEIGFGVEVNVLNLKLLFNIS